MVGCTRQSVNKLLGQFTDDGYLRLEREAIVVTDLDGPRAGVAPLGVRAGSVAGARSVSSRIAAAASAARLRPLAPSRKTSRRCRRLPAGVTTATDDRGVAAPRRHAQRQPDLGAAERHRPPGVRLERVRPGPASSPARRRPASRAPSAPGVSAASASLKRSQGTSPNSAASWPAVPISTTDEASSRARRGARRSPPPRSSSPVAQTYVAGRSRAIARGRLHVRLGGRGRRRPTAEIRTSTASTRA